MMYRKLPDEHLESMPLQTFIRRYRHAVTPTADLSSVTRCAASGLFRVDVQFGAGSDLGRPFGRAQD
jgi:hypothetical protein